MKNYALAVCLVSALALVAPQYAHANIFDDIGKAAKKVAHDTKKAADNAGKAVKKEADKDTKAASDAVNKAAGDTEHAAEKAADDTKNAAEQAGKDVQKAADATGKAMTEAGKELEAQVASLAAQISKADLLHSCENWLMHMSAPPNGLFKNNTVLSSETCIRNYYSGYYCDGFDYVDKLIKILEDAGGAGADLADAAAAAAEKAPCNAETPANKLACGLIFGMANLGNKALQCVDGTLDKAFNQAKGMIETALSGKTGSDRQVEGDKLIQPFCRASGEFTFSSEVNAALSESGVGEAGEAVAAESYVTELYNAYKTAVSVDNAFRSAENYTSDVPACH